MTMLNTAAERNKLSAWVQTYSGCNPCHMANVREASPKALLKNNRCMMRFHLCFTGQDWSFVRY